MTDSIDTNLVLRCILGDVPEQRVKAAAFFASTSSTHYFSNLALLECIYVMETVDEMSREEIVNQLNFFLMRYNDSIVYDRDLTYVAFPYYLEHPKLSWADCALAVEAELKHHEPLFTFDKKLAQQLPQAKVLG